jgi:hypothetical protein
MVEHCSVARFRKNSIIRPIRLVDFLIRETYSGSHSTTGTLSKGLAKHDAFR